MKQTINYHGFFDEKTGLSEATRLNVEAMKTVGIEVCEINYNIENYQRLTSEIPHNGINIFHININHIDRFFFQNRDLELQHSYNIFYWAWEFPEIGNEAIRAIHHFDELWVPSNFCVNIFTPHTEKPVLRISHPIKKIEKNHEFRKEDYQISNERIYLTIFDALSTTIRKNPEATINAFLNVFKNDHDNILIIKTHNVEENLEIQKLLEEFKNEPNIRIISEHFSKEKLHSLLQQCDVLLSLHGSEGFGFTMAEAMSYGKIVIGTGYSGNLDFMNINNSFLVKYSLFQTSNIPGLSLEKYTLARPDLEDAIEKLRYINSHFEEMDNIKNNAEKEIAHHFSLEKIGTNIAARLNFIKIYLTKEEKGQTYNSQESLFHTAEITQLKERIDYLERTPYNKIRKKINIFFKFLKNK